MQSPKNAKFVSNNDLLLETNVKCKDCSVHQLGRPLAKFLEKWEVTSATFSISTVLHPDSGIVINKLFKIFIETKKSNFYVKNEGLGLLKCHKSRSFRETLPPWTPQQRRCPCTPPGTYDPLEPWLIYGVNSLRFYPSGILVHPDSPMNMHHFSWKEGVKYVTFVSE